MPVRFSDIYFKGYTTEITEIYLQLVIKSFAEMCF